jgi:2-desacetyl-2-hydroxyethyl bacteriochlorophyllide A dehydrogenase
VGYEEGRLKALVYLGPRRMEVQEVPEPDAGIGEVLIETAASAICGSDLHGFREASPRRIPPLIMGHETVGVIAAVGDGVDSARVGQRVVLKPIVACRSCEPCRSGRTNLCRTGRLVGRDLTGGFAARFAVSSEAAVDIAADVPDDLATLTEPLANAVHVTSRAVVSDDDVLVIGAGPIGALMARMAIHCGAARVFATDRITARLDLARAQGSIPLGPHDPEGSLGEATEGRGVDVVIDAVGTAETWSFGLRAVRPGGRVEAVGLGAAAGELDFFAVVGKEATITGSFGWVDEDFASALSLIGEGALDTTGWFTRASFADGQRVFEELVDGTDRFKVVLTP